MSVPTVCPKCARERRPGEDACPRCGLLVARWAAFVPEPAHPLVEDLWRGLEASWEDDQAHARFLDEALRQDCLDLAAARYAARLKNGDDARASAGLARAQTLVEQAHAARSQAERAATAGARAVNFLAIAVAGALLVVVLYLLGLALRR